MIHYGTEMNKLNFGVIGQSDGGITYAWNSALCVEAYSAWWQSVELSDGIA